MAIWLLSFRVTVSVSPLTVEVMVVLCCVASASKSNVIGVAETLEPPTSREPKTIALRMFHFDKVEWIVICCSGVGNVIGRRDAGDALAAPKGCSGFPRDVSIRLTRKHVSGRLNCAACDPRRPR